MADQRTHVEPFFLPVEPGVRFCLLHKPASGGATRGGILYVHPFAEEMNKSRRMAAMQARSFAALGYAVLQIDLLGCGDSSGELLDATVSGWRADLDVAAQWMLRQGFGPLKLWGLRFGALLAADWAGRSGKTIGVDGLVLWQPVTSGEIQLNQFLRISVAADLLAPGGTSGGGGVLRRRLAAGETLEVAGYDVTPALAREMGELSLADVALGDMTVDWLELTADVAGVMAPGSLRVAEHWESSRVPVKCHVVAGEPFWATVEITDCPALLQKTTQAARDRWLQSSPSSVV